MISTIRIILISSLVYLCSAAHTFHRAVKDFEKYGDTMNDCVPQAVKPLYCDHSAKYRTLDGRCNNLQNSIQGAAFTKQQRFLPAKYFDENEIDSPIGYPGLNKPINVPTPLEVTKKIFEINIDRNNAKKVSNLHMTFGQFLDHDLSLTPKDGKFPCDDKPICSKDNNEATFNYPCLPIRYTRSKSSSKCMKFIRSKAICEQNRALGESVRQQPNIISSYIDASMVYSVNATKLLKIREDRKHENGKLRVTQNNLLPFDPESEHKCRTRGGCFLSGDIRADEHIALVSFHTLFVREHNRIADELAQNHLDWDGDKIFNVTRKILGAIMQHITYNEYVPTLAKLDSYQGYNEFIDSSIANVFSTAAFRFGHSQIRDSWAQLNERFEPIQNNILLRETFFNNTVLFKNGIEPTFYGLIANQSSSVDCSFTPGVAKHLFKPLGDHLFRSLAALNIQRGRDHGLPGYNNWRELCGLKRVRRFSKMLEIPRKQRKILQKLYKKVDNNIDVFAAGLAENHVDGLMVGPTFSCLLKKQFENLRNGDRFYYERDGIFSSSQLHEIKKVSLAKLLCNNLKGVVSMQRNVFHAFEPGKTKRHECGSIPDMDLKKW